MIKPKKGSILWQDVLSFDHEWLKKHGILNEKTRVDAQKLMTATRKGMMELLRREHMEDSAVWTAAIHYYNDNIHIHIATVEPMPTRSRGKRKPKTLERIKSKVANELTNLTSHRQKVDELLRERIIGSRKEMSSTEDYKMKYLFRTAMQALPDDPKQWQYGYNSIAHVRPLLDRMSDIYLQKYCQTDVKELHLLLDKQVATEKEVYGERFDSSKRTSKQNKLEDLYKRLGNVTLREIRQLAKEQDRQSRRETVQQRRLSPRKAKVQQARFYKNLNRVMMCLQYAFGQDYDSWKNQRNFDQLEQQIERMKANMEYERG